MTTQITNNIGIPYPATGDGSYSATINAIFPFLDALTAIGGMGVQTKEYPSTTLDVAIAGGTFRNAAGAVVTYAGIATQAMTTTATNYVYLTDSGTLVVNTTGFPAGINYLPLATVVAGAGVISSVADARPVFTSRGRAGPILPRTAVTSTPTTLSAASAYIQVNVPSAAALLLPAASATPPESTIVIQDVSGASGVNNITMTRAGSDTINGATTAVITTNYGGIKLWCDGVSKWFLLP